MRTHLSRAAMLTCGLACHQPIVDRFVPPAPAPSADAHAAVATYDREATAEAIGVLREGGNACDAYVAATMVLYVRAAGETSLAGPMSALIFDATSGGVELIDGSSSAPLEATTASGAIGRGMLVPGAPASLFALIERHCSLPTERLFRRAIALARDGFEVDAAYAAIVSYRADLLRSTDYGRRTFFRDGHPLSEGALLTQPELADTLEALANEGAELMYRGAWASAFLEAAQRAGSKLTSEDLEGYRAIWRAPHRTSYRGVDVYGGAGRIMGGTQVLLALEILEHAQLPRLEHPSRSADALELLLRVWNAASSSYWLYDTAALDAADVVKGRLSDTAPLWARTHEALTPPAKVWLGSHSQTVTVIDAAGNGITGLNTIQSFPWGDGVFVGGVALPNAGAIAMPVLPGSRRIDTATFNVAVREGALVALGSTFNYSLREAAFQMWAHLLDFELPVDRALAEPRFGTYVVRADGTVDPTRQYLDPAISSSIAAALVERGVHVTQEAIEGGFLDVGLGTAATAGPRPQSAVMPSAWISRASADSF